jgi:hypothetical protein
MNPVHAPSHSIAILLWNLQGYYRVQKNLPLDPVAIQLYPVHAPSHSIAILLLHFLLVSVIVSSGRLGVLTKFIAKANPGVVDYL